jgi:hypothetical protein
MARYQELIENQIYKNIQDIIAVFNARPTPETMDSALSRQSVLNMLNTRYIIYNPEAPPLVNNSELGNAWFVDTFRLVNGAREEMDALSAFDPSREAIIEKSFEEGLSGFKSTPDSNAQILLTEYRANYLKYNSNSSSEQLAVFSEIYYDKGWQAFIDGNPASHIRVNYILRALRIPAGEHSLEFKFHPRSYYMSASISLVSSLLFLALFAGAAFMEWRKKKSGKDPKQAGT